MKFKYDSSITWILKKGKRNSNGNANWSTVSVLTNKGPFFFLLSFVKDVLSAVSFHELVIRERQSSRDVIRPDPHVIVRFGNLVGEKI